MFKYLTTGKLNSSIRSLLFEHKDLTVVFLTDIKLKNVNWKSEQKLENKTIKILLWCF
jgi:hypothetical protein